MNANNKNRDEMNMENTNPILTIVHCSDPHVSIKNEKYLKNFLKVIDYINNLIKPNVAVITGDLVENPEEDNFFLF